MSDNISSFSSGFLLLFLIGIFTLTSCQNTSKKDKSTKEDKKVENQRGSEKTAKNLYPDPEKSKSDKKTHQIKAKDQDSNVIEIGYVNWTEGIAMTHLAEQILEKKMGYTVHKRLGYVGEILDSLAWGTNDFFLDHWLSADSSLGKMADFVDLGINYKGAKMGLVVPKYMKGINSIKELKGYKGTNKRIVGIDAGADIMDKARKAIKAYDLNYKLIVSSGPAMARELNTAIQNQQPIVVTGWAPHWKFSKFELKFLEDPKKIFGTTKNIHTLARKGLAEDHPKVAEFLRNFHMNEEQLGNLIEVFAASNDWNKAAEKWMNNHEELVNSWLPKKVSS